MAHDVFISYSTKDKVIADAVCAKLEENKIRVWIAPRDVPPGSNFARAIISAVNVCKVFVLIWSENTSEHILTEVNQAFDRSITIIPFRIQNIQPTEDLQYYIGRTHWLDAIDPPLESHIKDLIDTVNANLGRDKHFIEAKPPELPQTEIIPAREKTEEKPAKGEVPLPPPIQYPQKEFTPADKKRMGIGKLLLIAVGIVVMILAFVLLVSKIISPSLAANSTPSVTPTVTAVPTPATTPIPPENFLLIKDFEDGYIGDWDNRSSTPLEVLTENGNHFVHFTATGDLGYPGMWYIGVGEDWKDYAFESRIRFYGQGVAYCFYENNGSFYQGGLNYPSGTWLSDFIPNLTVPYQTFATGDSTIESNRWYLVRIEVLGDQIAMYIDNRQVLTAQRSSIPYGGIGFITNTENKGQFDVDDIRVWKLK